MDDDDDHGDGDGEEHGDEDFMQMTIRLVFHVNECE